MAVIKLNILLRLVSPVSFALFHVARKPLSNAHVTHLTLPRRHRSGPSAADGEALGVGGTLEALSENQAHPQHREEAAEMPG